jgi:hypothetical protein
LRNLTNLERLNAFFDRIQRGVRDQVSVYLTGGACALLKGWRETTLDIDFIFEPEIEVIYKNIPEIKIDLKINLEVASPSHFLPELPGWKDRSEFIKTCGKVSFYHYDFYSQALSKLERFHTQDIRDVQSMLDNSLIDPQKLHEYFKAIEGKIFKYPSIDPRELEQKILNLIADFR